MPIQRAKLQKTIEQAKALACFLHIIDNLFLASIELLSQLPVWTTRLLYHSETTKYTLLPSAFTINKLWLSVYCLTAFRLQHKGMGMTVAVHVIRRPSHTLYHERHTTRTTAVVQPPFAWKHPSTTLQYTILYIEIYNENQKNRLPQNLSNRNPIKRTDYKTQKNRFQTYKARSTKNRRTDYRKRKRLCIIFLIQSRNNNISRN